MSVIIAMRHSFTPNWRHDGGSVVAQCKMRRRCVEIVSEDT